MELLDIKIMRVDGNTVYQVWGLIFLLQMDEVVLDGMLCQVDRLV